MGVTVKPAAAGKGSRYTIHVSSAWVDIANILLSSFAVPEALG